MELRSALRQAEATSEVDVAFFAEPRAKFVIRAGDFGLDCLFLLLIYLNAEVTLASTPTVCYLFISSAMAASKGYKLFKEYQDFRRFERSIHDRCYLDRLVVFKSSDLPTTRKRIAGSACSG